MIVWGVLIRRGDLAPRPPWEFDALIVSGALGLIAIVIFYFLYRWQLAKIKTLPLTTAAPLQPQHSQRGAE